MSACPDELHSSARTIFLTREKYGFPSLTEEDLDIIFRTEQRDDVGDFVDEFAEPEPSIPQHLQVDIRIMNILDNMVVFLAKSIFNKYYYDEPIHLFIHNYLEKRGRLAPIPVDPGYVKKCHDPYLNAEQFEKMMTPEMKKQKDTIMNFIYRTLLRKSFDEALRKNEIKRIILELYRKYAYNDDEDTQEYATECTNIIELTYLVHDEIQRRARLKEKMIAWRRASKS